MRDRMKKTLIGVPTLVGLTLGAGAIAQAGGAGSTAPAVEAGTFADRSVQADPNAKGEADGQDDRDELVIGPEADRARQAALEGTGGGAAGVVEREVADEEPEDADDELGDDDEPGEREPAGVAYEVEVRKDDGTQVEVSLDGDFGILAIEADDD